MNKARIKNIALLIIAIAIGYFVIGELIVNLIK